MKNTNNHIEKNLAAFSLGLLLFIMIVFVTNPQDLHAMVLLLVPTSIAFMTYQGTVLVLRLLQVSSESQRKFMAAMMSVGVTLVAALGTLHQLSIQDFFLAALLVGGLSWYLKRLRFSGSYGPVSHSD